ncbi:LuxR family transcriptional regulator [Paraburkholderia sp. Ac-20336]|uniref:helix-turn-helix transcriptional regulator n=1 Tax=Burkholderiaceae TaxID=119060 RepID=UPI001423746E|nr:MULTISPECIES: LuxR family transcriptional regulator [Burkholderiaceae]MBN3802025.1 LuxR family transcriptional regulator [Paraburkholderia sp. Ac-20336]MBN3845461.1 LuxR family transcriptional regulator [Paraburkholderia sp. Ac-20342]NIF54298.1 LuxR family transcriptional regulator [Burkholderia sp. Ax-1724]NIF76455.1 LuxR family transcriptional regulator [Paraburkholderia sp. Cy-641]
MAPLLDAADEAEWFGAIAGLAETWGFDRILIAMLPRPTMRLEDAYLRSTYAPAWRQTYDDTGMVHIDPTVAHCLSRVAPLIWTPDLFSTTAQQALYEEARSYGLRSGVSLPIHGPNQEAGMMCFVNDSNPSEEFRRDLNAVLPNLVLLRDLVIDTSQRHLNTHAQTLLPKLTPRERECLKWTARGKSTWEISHILNCSEAVVNFHMKNIRTKFGVNSRRAAAVIAAQLGLIDPG